jgi:hypothetical protein
MFVAINTNKDNRVVGWGVMMGNNNGDEPEKEPPALRGLGIVLVQRRNWRRRSGQKMDHARSEPSRPAQS